MSGSSSQRRTYPPMSPIHAFPIEDMYTPDFWTLFKKTPFLFKNPLVRNLPLRSRPHHRKRRNRLEDAKRGRFKAMMHPGRLHRHMRKKLCCVKYMESKTKQYGRRTYDMVNGKWKTVRPAVVRFCGVYGNVMRRLQESGASDADYYARALMDYEAESGTTFKLRHCSEILKDSPKWMQIGLPKFSAKSGEGSKRYKSSGSSSFNTESGETSINLNANVGDDDEDEVQKIRRPIGRDKAKDAAKKKGSRASGSSSTNDEALARLMVTEMASQEKEERLAFLEIKKREVECREREVRNQEYRQCQDDIRFYLQPYDHLTGDARLAMEELRAEIKAKYDLSY
ncbi:RNA-directed DNA polymerase, eukaryota, reverse transcriptase zinc-binding domain protein [Tanacetum coccineum]